MKKSSKTFLALAIASLFAASWSFAADTKTESKVANCCAKAQAAGKTCDHACCVEAAKNGMNCTKCGGSGHIEKKADAKK